MDSNYRNRLKSIISESVSEISAKKQNWFSKNAGIEPGFNKNNPRHAKAYESLMVWRRFVQEKYKIRDGVIANMLESFIDDLKYGQ